MTTVSIDRITSRRFVLGRQGLWPGRRWRGVRGTEAAMRALEHLQLDPLNVVARGHELMLQSRVVDYPLGLWEELTYGQRKFFEWGGWLAVRPMDELPHYRRLMQRESQDPRLKKQAALHAKAIDEMRRLLTRCETISSRELDAGTGQRLTHYRGGKASSVALYHLWRRGEVMVQRRDGFERVYSLAERVAPAELLRESADDDADRFLIKKQIGFYGLWRFPSLSYLLKRTVSAAEALHWRERLVREDEILPLRIESSRQTLYALARDRRLLQQIGDGHIPPAWKPIDTTTEAEVTLLSPFDVVCARGRAQDLFGFEHVWEAYKPQVKRRWGYYTMPILWGDRLVARVDPKLERETNTLVLLGLWLEDAPTAKDAAFAAALGRGLLRLMTFLGAARVDVERVRPRALRLALEAGCAHAPGSH